MGLSWLVFEMKPWDGQADTGPMSATIAHLAVSESTKCILSKTELFVTNFLWPFNAHELRFNVAVSRVQWYSCSSPTILVNFMYTSHDGTSCDQRRRQHGKSNAARGCYAFLVPVLLLLTQWRPLWLEMAEHCRNSLLAGSVRDDLSVAALTASTCNRISSVDRSPLAI